MKKWFFIICFLPIHAFAQIITTIAGTGVAGFGGDNGPATLAMFNRPGGLTIDEDNNIYIGDLNNYRVRKIDSFGIITTIAGTGVNACSGDNGPATAAKFNHIEYIYIYMHILYIPDEFCFVIRKIDTNNYIYNIAGNGCDSTPPTNYGDGGMATNACIIYPCAVKVDKIGNIFFTDGYARIRKIDTNGIIHTYAGTTQGFSGDNGLAVSAQLNVPGGLIFDNFGNLLFIDYGNFRIRKIDTNGIITTIAGIGFVGYSGDNGPATNAALYYPEDITVDGGNNIYVADLGNNVIRKIDTYGIITTVVGNGYGAGTTTGGYGGDNGPATAAMLYEPAGLEFDKQGNLYIADFRNNRVRKVSNLGVPIGVRGAVSREREDLLHIYPNPAGSELFVEGVVGCQIAFFDVVGSEKLKMKSEKLKTVVDISGLAKGVYVVEVVNLETGLKVVKRMVKE